MRDTQSWFYMPLILAPFRDINVYFDPEIDIQLNQLNIGRNFGFDNPWTIDTIINKITNFYNKYNVNLNDHKSLERLNFMYDSPLHLIGDHQTSLLENVGDDANIIVETILNHFYLPEHVNNFKNLVISYDYNLNYTDETFNITYFTKNYTDQINGNWNRLIKCACVMRPNDNTMYEFIYQKLNARDIDVVIRHIGDPNYTNKDQVLIYFGGWGERHNAMRALFNYNGYIIYFCDKYNEWYSAFISAYIQFINEYAVNINNYIFMGVSMGGYAALHASVYFPTKNNICIALGPQTIKMDNYLNILLKDDVIHENQNNQKRPLIQSVPIYKNIPEVLNENQNYNTKIYILVGKSECDDYNELQTPLYLDTLHMGAIINYPNVSSIIYNIASHRIQQKLNLKDLFRIIQEHFYTLFNDQNQGNILIKEEVNYFTR